MDYWDPAPNFQASNTLRKGIAKALRTAVGAPTARTVATGLQLDKMDWGCGYLALFWAVCEGIVDPPESWFDLCHFMASKGAMKTGDSPLTETRLVGSFPPHLWVGLACTKALNLDTRRPLVGGGAGQDSGLVNRE